MNKGFSLVEFMIYVGILAASAVFLISILVVFTNVHVRQSSLETVNSQVSFVNNTFQRMVRNSSLVNIPPGVSTTTLSLRMSSSTLDPTLIYLDESEGTLYLQEGSSSAKPITDAAVSVDNFNVTKYENPGGHSVVQMDLALSYKTSNLRAEHSRSIRTAVSRVSAATFDSDILPNNDNSYDLGNAGSTWRDAYFSGNVGIGTSPVTSARIKTTGDLAFTTSTKGIVFTTPDGTCLRLTLGNNGDIATSSVSCP